MLINQGVVRVAVNGALGTADSGTVIADGATLDVGGALGVSTLNLQSEPITVSGTGTDGQGAIVNSSANEQWYASGQVALNGDTTFGGTGRWDIRDGSFKMNDHTLTKKGNAWFALSQTVVTPGGTNAAIDVQAGTLRVQRQADLGGNSDNTLHLRSGTSINFYDVWSYPAWRLICENNTSFFVDFSSAMPRNVWYGPVVLNGTLALTSGGGFVGGFAGNVSGTGALIKNGAHTFYLTGTNNTYSGTTIVSNGTLCAQAPGSLPGYGTANRVTVAGGATLIVATGDGTTGFTAEQIRSVNTCTKFLTNTAVLGIDTTLTGLDIPGDLPGFMSLAKLGTNTLSLSGTATNLGNLAIYQGLLALDGTLNQHSGTCYLEGSPSSNALLRINAGASLSGSGDFSIRNNGAFYMDGGTFTRPTSLGFGERFALGFNNGGYGYLKMSGGTLTSERIILGTANNTTAGYGGIGIARFTGGTASFSYIPHFGSSPGSIGVLTVDAGGTFLKTGGECWLAYEGGRCEVNLTGGLFNNNGNNFRVGESGRNSATGIVNLCDGRFANAILNRYSGAFFMNFCGGTFAAGSGTPSELFSSSLTGIYSYGPVGEFAGGAVFDSTGRNVTVSSPIQAPPGQGVYAIALTHPGSGYIGEPYVQIRGGGGDGATAVADLTDDGTGCGTFKIARVTITCPGFGYTSEPTVTFIKGGANAVTAMGTASLAQNVSGGLTKRGAGILTLSGANTYTGTTTVVDGTLKLGVANALQTNTLISLAGGTLDLNGYTVTNAFAGTGLVTNGNAVTTFSPAGTGTLGTNTLTLADTTVKGTYLADMTADGDSDRLNIGGPIDLSNIELHIVDTNRLNRHQTYTIMACMGTRTGTFKTTNLPDSHWHVIYQLDGTIKLLFTSGTIITIF